MYRQLHSSIKLIILAMIRRLPANDPVAGTLLGLTRRVDCANEAPSFCRNLPSQRMHDNAGQSAGGIWPGSERLAGATMCDGLATYGYARYADARPIFDPSAGAA